MFHQWAPGAAFWLGKGTTLYNLLADYMREVLFPAGYAEVKTPLIYNKALWETSGHWQHYRENMFLIESEGETMSREADELPGPLAGLRERECAAIATCRCAFTSRRRCIATRRRACCRA